MDWGSIFVPDQPILETVIRGSLTYLGIILLMRLVLKRQSGSLGLGDMLLVVMIADASQNGMAGDHRSWPNGIVLVGTLLFWNYAIDWATYRWQWARTLFEPEPTTLVRNGRLQVRNLEREQITCEELEAALRINGLDDYRRVREARIESGGFLSVVPIDSPSSARDESESTDELSGAPVPRDLERLLQDLRRELDRLEAVVDAQARTEIREQDPGTARRSEKRRSRRSKTPASAARSGRRVNQDHRGSES